MRMYFVLMVMVKGNSTITIWLVYRSPNIRRNACKTIKTEDVSNAGTP